MKAVPVVASWTSWSNFSGLDHARALGLADLAGRHLRSAAAPTIPTGQEDGRQGHTLRFGAVPVDCLGADSRQPRPSGPQVAGSSQALVALAAPTPGVRWLDARGPHTGAGEHHRIGRTTVGLGLTLGLNSRPSWRCSWYTWTPVGSQPWTDPLKAEASRSELMALCGVPPLSSATPFWKRHSPQHGSPRDWPIPWP